MTYQKKDMVVFHSYDVKLLQSNKPKMALEYCSLEVSLAKKIG